jgi:hypothetical protein
MVSTNRVYRLILDTGDTVVAKVSNYGSFFLFAEDHDRLHRATRLLAGTRYERFLASMLSDDKGGPYIFYDGEYWATLYEEVPIGDRLPRILTEAQIDNLAIEMAEFHHACHEVGSQIPPRQRRLNPTRSTCWKWCRIVMPLSSLVLTKADSTSCGGTAIDS